MHTKHTEIEKSGNSENNEFTDKEIKQANEIPQREASSGTLQIKAVMGSIQTG